MNFRKVIIGELTYYILDSHMNAVDWDSPHNIMLYSQFVVNRVTNEVIKCRASMQDLVDAFVASPVAARMFDIT